MPEPAPDLLTHLKQLEAADPGGLPYRTALIQAYERIDRLEATGARMAAAVRQFAAWVDKDEPETPSAAELRESYRGFLTALNKGVASAK